MNKKSALPHITIYTDGACKGNPGPGGWGAVLRSGHHEKHLHGGALLTTNNRMEISAVIHANWRTAAKAPVKNADLWQELDSLLPEHTISWHWVRGHNGDPGNELADQLANRGVEEFLP
ncbi:MAG: ribonuclease HI [Burkholderiaceae bacterium]|nr:ribonuclease HI [Burkholderiaceae bacterium]